MGKSFAASRRVPQRDRVRSRIKTDFVGPGVRARAIRAESDGPDVTRGAHFFRSFLERPRRRVLFCRVMNLPAPRFVFGMLGKERRRMTNSLEDRKSVVEGKRAR